MAAPFEIPAAFDPKNPEWVDAVLKSLRDVLLGSRSWSFTAEPVAAFRPGDRPTLYVELRIEPFQAD